MNIFYSWQADTPDRVGKAFIRLALDSAVDKAAADLNLNEAERPKVDQDTQDVMGAPPIAETIFEKIRNSEVVVVDVTLIGDTEDGKKLINSNVGCELGYAHGHHGDQALLAVMNTHYGPPDDLPFDLKHRRWPVGFELAPDATRAQIREAREQLASKLAAILKLYVEGRPPGTNYEPIRATDSPASYWREGKLLVDIHKARGYEDPVQLGYTPGQPLCYLRVWPDEPLAELSGTELGDYQNTSIEPLLGRSHGGYSYDRNKYGTVTYVGANAGYLIAATQVFKNREIWGTECFTLRAREEYAHDFVPMGAYEEGMIRSLPKYLRVAFDKLGYGDLANVEAGLVNVKGFLLAMPANYTDQMWGPVYEDVTVQGTIERGDADAVTTFLLSLFKKVFDAAGTTRPANLHGFPGNG